MIQFRSGDLLHDDAEALVNTVNCVGVMGKGLAAQFKAAYPEMYLDYVRACNQGWLSIGELHRWVTPDDRYIINLPTKRHWRQPSSVDDVAKGILALRDLLVAYRIESVAIPPLGCGLGGLDWRVVRGWLVVSLGDLDVDIRLYGTAP